MSWDALTASDVLSEFNTSERTNIANTVGTDNLAAITARVVEEVRGACQAGNNLIGPAGTIPSQLTGDAIAIAKWRFLLALPLMPQIQTEDRKDAFDTARETLQMIATEEMAVEVPAAGTALPLTLPGNDLEVGDNLQPRYFTRDTLNGL